MTVETDLYALLGPLAGGRCYPDVAPLGVVLPYLTYQQVGGDPANFLAGVPNKRNGRFQVNAWAVDRIGAAALIRAVEDAIRPAASLNAISVSGAVAVRDEETHYFGARQDFSIWFVN